MVSKAEKARIESEGGIATMASAPEGSADRVHDEDELLHPPKSSVEPLAHAFCPPDTRHYAGPGFERCTDCGYEFRDHNPDFGQPVTEPGDAQIRVTDYANGESVDRDVAPKASAQTSLPGVDGHVWGEYEDHALSHRQFSFGGSPHFPKELADMFANGHLKSQERMHFLVSGHVGKSEFGPDAHGVYFGKTKFKIDIVSVTNKRIVPDEDVAAPIPPELIRKSLVTGLIEDAACWLAAIPSEEDPKDALEEAKSLIENLAHLLDPLPFEDDDDDALPISTPNPRGEESVPSQLEQAIAEAMAEA